MILFLSHLALAQDATSYSIEDALRRALETSEQVASSESAVRAAIGQGWAARSGFGPQAYGTLAYQHTFESEYDYLSEPPLVPDDDTGAGTTGTTTGKKVPDEEAAAFDISSIFGQPDSWRADLVVTQPIIAPGAIAATRLAGASLDVAKLDLESTRASTTLSAAQAYFGAALADQLLAIGEATLAQVKTTFEHAKLAKDLGRQSEFELLRAQVEVENQQVNVVHLRRAREQAFLQVALVLHVPEGAQIQLTSPLDAAALPQIGEVARTVAGVRDSSTRLAVKSAEKSVRMSKDNVWIVRSQALPTLSAMLDYGQVRYPDDPWIFDKADRPGVSDHGTDGTENIPQNIYEVLHGWHTNFFVGATLTVPLFGFGRAFGENLTAVSGVHQAEAGLELTQQAAIADSRDAQLSLESAQAQWDATAGTVEVAQRAYDIGSVRFNEGVSTQSELSDARILLQQALANRAQAARDLQIARIRAALLPALPLSSL
jgi:outer membrane protein